MREVTCSRISQAVATLAIECNLYLPDDVTQLIRKSLESEDDELSRSILEDILQNHRIAAQQGMALCQDTGVAVVFLEVGQEVHISGGFLYDAVNAGVARGYTEGYLRKSMVRHPWQRVNSGDNTPAIIHVDIVPGDQLKITMMPKGGGAENYAGLAMLTPAQGLEGAKQFAVDCVKKAGPNACPPVVVGVGIGGNFESVPMLAKRALCRPLGQSNASKEVAQVEADLLREINQLGIGPQGLGGKTTALSVAVEIAPCHIASFPVAVNLNCHVARCKSIVL